MELSPPTNLDFLQAYIKEALVIYNFTCHISNAKVPLLRLLESKRDPSYLYYIGQQIQVDESQEECNKIVELVNQYIYNKKPNEIDFSKWLPDGKVVIPETNPLIYDSLAGLNFKNNCFIPEKSPIGEFIEEVTNRKKNFISGLPDVNHLDELEEEDWTQYSNILVSLIDYLNTLCKKSTTNQSWKSYWGVVYYLIFPLLSYHPQLSQINEMLLNLYEMESRTTDDQDNLIRITLDQIIDNVITIKNSQSLNETNWSEYDQGCLEIIMRLIIMTKEFGIDKRDQMLEINRKSKNYKNELYQKLLTCKSFLKFPEPF